MTYYTYVDDHVMGKNGVEPEGPPIITTQGGDADWRVATDKEVAEYELWWNTYHSAIDQAIPEREAGELATKALARHRKEV